MTTRCHFPVNTQTNLPNRSGNDDRDHRGIYRDEATHECEAAAIYIDDRRVCCQLTTGSKSLDQLTRIAGRR